MAIVTFKSNAAGEIYMFRETAEKVFKVIGKPLGIRGVLTPEELPAAMHVCIHIHNRNSRGQTRKVSSDMWYDHV